MTSILEGLADHKLSAFFKGELMSVFFQSQKYKFRRKKRKSTELALTDEPPGKLQRFIFFLRARKKKMENN